MRAADVYGCGSMRPGESRCTTSQPFTLKSSAISPRWHCHHIASAHITTFGEKAIDVFYVTDLTGDKILNPARHAQIERELMKVLAPLPERLANSA